MVKNYGLCGLCRKNGDSENSFKCEEMGNFLWGLNITAALLNDYLCV